MRAEREAAAEGRRDRSRTGAADPASVPIEERIEALEARLDHPRRAVSAGGGTARELDELYEAFTS